MSLTERIITNENAHRNYDAMRGFWESHWSATKFEEEYQTNFYSRRQEEFAAIIAHLPKDEFIIEAGCSFGHVAEYFRTLGYRVLGVDYVFDSLAAGHAHAPQLKLAQGDIHSLPFADNSIGGYLSFGVLEHFEFGPMPALREAFRVLKPGGVIALTMPVPTPLVREWIPKLRPWLKLDPLRRNNQLRRLFGKDQLGAASNGSNGNAFYEQPYSEAEVRNFLQEAGFTVVAQMPIYHSFWLWLASGMFRDKQNYFKPNRSAELIGARLKKFLPWSTAFMGLAIARRPY